MTVCRTAVEPFFSVSWRSGLSEGEGFWNRSGNVVHFFNSLLARIMQPFEFTRRKGIVKLTARIAQ